MSKNRAKKLFVPMRITRVALNPEQAVLTCCDLLTRGAQAKGNQCSHLDCWNSMSDAVSS